MLLFHSRRASSLASTLLLIAICVTLAFTVVSLAFHHLNMGNRLGNAQQARNLAESAVSLTLQKILKAEGKYPVPGDDTVEVHFPDCDDAAFGITTFNVTVAGQKKLDLSLNNLKKDAATTAPNGHVVPQEAVYLVGLGHCGGVDRRIEAILHVPIFQSAISAEAPLNAGGPMLVASADSSADDELLLHPENHLTQLKPAHVTTNKDALLGQDVLITGFAQAVGNIDTTPGNATVKGGLRPQGGRSEVPALDVNEFDPAKLGKTHMLGNTGSNYDADGGLIKMDASVSGDTLKLPDGVSKSGALVFVKGDVTFKEITGVGAVIATGNISITGSTNLSSEGTVALLSGGNLSLVGAKDNADAVIKGIAYAGGDLHVDNVTLVGTMVQAGSSPTSSLKVTRSNFIKTDDTVDFEFEMPFGVDAGSGERLVLKEKLEHYYDETLDAYAKAGSPVKPVKPADFGFFDGRTVAQVAAAWETTPPAVAPPGVVPFWDPAMGPEPTSWSQVSGTPASAANIETYLNNYIATQVSRMNGELVKIEAFYDQFKLQPKAKGHISFNPTRFLTLSKAARIILWKDR